VLSLPRSVPWHMPTWATELGWYSLEADLGQVDDGGGPAEGSDHGTPEDWGLQRRVARALVGARAANRYRKGAGAVEARSQGHGLLAEAIVLAPSAFAASGASPQTRDETAIAVAINPLV
jgi:hypothetical protein